MKDENKKIKRRGFVMTGGGAKGLYEAGVIHAFHITGMEFDVITGSSIGAMNSAFFAEYLLRKRNYYGYNPAEPGPDPHPEKTIKEMEGLIRSYQRAWLLMPDQNIIDDGPDSKLGLLVKDLGKFDLSLADVTKIGWWWTDPKRSGLPSLPAVLRISKELVERLKTMGPLKELRKAWKAKKADSKSPPGDDEASRIFQRRLQTILREATRTYLKRFEMEKSLIPEGSDGDKIIEDMFTQPQAPLQSEDLDGPIDSHLQDPDKGEILIDPTRTFKDFANKGITLRMTRSNYRTGRLEISGYLAPDAFMRYLSKQLWRMDVASEKMPLGFRVQLPGNPNVIKAALASGRFPGVFAPFPFEKIYPKNPENALAYKLLDWSNDPGVQATQWVNPSEVQAELKTAYQNAYEEEKEKEEKDWQALLTRLKKPNIRDFFPYVSDTYLDGGTIDNTPNNSAQDATREWINANDKIGIRDVTLDLFVVFLEAEPKISRDEAQEPLLNEVVKRTLDVQAIALKTGDEEMARATQNFGDAAEALARTLLSLLEALNNNQLDDEQRKNLEETVRKIASDQGLTGYLGDKSGKHILARMEIWANKKLQGSLPLQVQEIKIYPDKMPLSTLAFTERLGYRKDNAIEMLTMGCYNTLWELRKHLEEQSSRQEDEQDKQVLKMVKQWMGSKTWPHKNKRADDPEDYSYRDELDTLRQEWRCTHSECLFYEKYCEKSKGKQGK